MPRNHDHQRPNRKIRQNPNPQFPTTPSLSPFKNRTRPLNRDPQPPNQRPADPLLRKPDLNDR